MDSRSKNFFSWPHNAIYDTMEKGHSLLDPKNWLLMKAALQILRPNSEVIGTISHF